MSAPLWTSSEIVRATGGRLAGAAFDAMGVSIDSRTVEPGDLFVALAGIRDGHDFIDGALGLGAAGSLATREGSGSRVLVGDTQIALEALGLAARDRCSAKRGAVTGSVGKTSVTQAVRAGLLKAGRGHASVKSYNNQIGVPLTLARMPKTTERAVFEIGMNHAGEIEPLSRLVAPHVVCITTVGPVHTENFDDGEAGVAKAKAEIFAGLVPGGVAVLNADNAWFNFLKSEALRAGAVVHSFGSGPDCDARLLGVSAGEAGAEVSVSLRGRRLDLSIRPKGAHWGLNSLAVLLILEALDVSLDDALAALESFEPLEGRGSERAIMAAAGPFVLIDESYNANPMSMQAALSTLGARAAKGRRIAVLTDMLELGAQAPRYHLEIAQSVDRADVDLVFCAGPLMRFLWDALPATRQGGYAESAADLALQVVRAVEPGDLVMVKGSNGSKASMVAQALTALGVGDGSQMEAGG
ncbi:MAG TPA: UDP-N-acetylmuramoyl-tripeptide--D-alanyl-D-alanine ligase [Caulobacteraceae bacterium]|nr:UDP-N-acetylmuramoyl-tripeptide--D-alanyl-D-alanine ligase [Caulobacteraceae bacterium]